MKTLEKIKAKICQLEKGLLYGQTPLSYIELGILCQTIKEYDKAEVAFKKATATLPDNVYPRFLLLRLYEAKGEWATANRMARELMQSDHSKMSLGLKQKIYKSLHWNANAGKTMESPKGVATELAKDKGQNYPMRKISASTQPDTRFQNTIL